jgi:hypothetical protein
MAFSISTGASASAGDIINRVAVEVGLTKVPDPYASQDNNFIQMQELLNIAGDELTYMYDWSACSRVAVVDTSLDDSGEYPFPADFQRITNQTAWELNNRIPVRSLSAQQWAMMEGRQFAKDTIYAKFRIQQGQFTIFPQPAPANLLINYEYMSINWVTDGLTPDTLKTECTQFSDKPFYPRLVISRYLKVKWLLAKGLDASAAQDDFNQIFDNITSTDKGAPILNAGNGAFGVPLLNGWDNIGDSGFGSS